MWTQACLPRGFVDFSSVATATATWKEEASLHGTSFVMLTCMTVKRTVEATVHTFAVWLLELTLSCGAGAQFEFNLALKARTFVTQPSQSVTVRL